MWLFFIAIYPQKPVFIHKIAVFLRIFEDFGIALVVRDSDGSAFITKAEFDSLQNNFQSQIDTYNSSLDNKIDMAISAYLSGVKLINQTNTQGNISELVWPLRVISRLSCTSSIYPTAVQTAPIIRTGYKFYVNDTNRAFHTVDFYETTTPSVNEIWLGGSWNSGKFYVTGRNNEPIIKIIGMSFSDHWGTPTTGGTEDLGNGSLLLDWKYSARTDRTTWDDSIKSKSRNNSCDYGQKLVILSDGEINGLINTSSYTTLNNILLAFVRCDKKNHASWTSTESFDKWPATSSGRAMVRRVPVDANTYLKWQFESMYTQGIKYIYNVSDTEVTSNNKYFVAPSIANGGKDLYVTNMKNSRKIYKNADKSPNLTYMYHNNGSTSDTKKTNYGIISIVTTGLNIESPYNALTSHTYNDNYSAVETSKLCYEYKKSNGSKEVQDMVKGIPIYTFPIAYADGLQDLEITINIKSEKSSTESNQKYICFSTKPVDKTVYGGTSPENTAIAGNADLLVIKNGGAGEVAGTNGKLFKVSEGANTFKFEKTSKVSVGDVIYVKLYFADSEQYIDLVNNPDIKFQY